MPQFTSPTSPLSGYPNDKQKYGFTLVELLAVIAIIAVLAAILIPVIGNIRSSSEKAGCVSNMRNLGVAFLTYHSENGRLPNNGIVIPLSNWDVDLLPYLGIEQYDGWTPNAGVSSSAPGSAFSVFHCPADSTPRTEGFFAQSYSLTGWACNAGGIYTPFGANWPANEGARIAQVGDPAKTALLVENTLAAREDGRRVGQWANSLADNPGLDASQWQHNGATNVLFFDGHVETITLEDFPPAEVNGSTITGITWNERFMNLE